MVNDERPNGRRKLAKKNWLRKKIRSARCARSFEMRRSAQIAAPYCSPATFFFATFLPD
jgi:hypothetical protein